MDSHSFYAMSVLSGRAFKEMLESFRANVAPFKGGPEYRRGDTFRWWSSVVASQHLVLLHKACTRDWRAEIETEMEGLTVVIPMSGGGADTQVGGDKVTARSNHTILTASPLLLSLTAQSRPQLSTASLIFQEATVKQILSSMYEEALPNKLELSPLFDLSTGHGATFKLLVQTIISGMQGERVLERSPKSMALLTEAALRIIVENVPHRFSNRLYGKPCDVVPRHVKIAIDYMHANMYHPLTVTDIAEAAGVSARSLQMGFQQFRDTTPIAYLRRIRLKAVHVELSLPQNELSIKEVALKWGFTHLGSFAQQYRAAYGVHPSATVKQARTNDPTISD